MYVFVMQTVVVGEVYQYRTLLEVNKAMWNSFEYLYMFLATI